MSFADLPTAVHHTLGSTKRGRRRALFRLLLMLRLLLLYSSALLLLQLCSLTISLECKRRASRSQGSSLLSSLSMLCDIVWAKMRFSGLYNIEDVR